MKGRRSTKDNRDEDLLLFKELHKREKAHFISLLQPPVSEEFEPNAAAAGNYALYKSMKKGTGSGYDFFGENVDKYDYDWLKTPPATPLFPSLEMETTNAPQLVLQRELPILREQPLSRFATSSTVELEAVKGICSGSKSKFPARSKTPTARNQRPIITPDSYNKIPKPTKESTADLHKSTADLHKSIHKVQKKTQTNIPAKNSAAVDSKAMPTRSYFVSPAVAKSSSRIIQGFSNETPPNLRTDRSTSATRGRPATPTKVPTISIQEKSRRQSCSPSVTRGRKQNESNLTFQKGKFQTDSGNTITTSTGTQIFGSRMVDKFMNARKLGAIEKETKTKPLVTKNSLNMETKRDRANPRHVGLVPVRNATRDYMN